MAVDAAPMAAIAQLTSARPATAPDDVPEPDVPESEIILLRQLVATQARFLDIALECVWALQMELDRKKDNQRNPTATPVNRR